MRIATWNIERPTGDTSARAQRILAKLNEINADLWILTETHDTISPGPDYHSTSTPTIAAPPILHKPGEHKTTIWSRWPIIEAYETSTPHRATCITLETPLGQLVVYGTVLPFHGARWPYGTPRNWDAHFAAIATQAGDWSRLRRKYPTHGFCLAGDLNQTCTGRLWYGTRWGRALLDLALNENNLIGVTQADFALAGKLSQENQTLVEMAIDHVCLDDHWARRVTRMGIWPKHTASGDYLSDHSGVFVDLIAGT